MADLALHTDGVTSVTCVSNIFIDHYMADANGEYVKIYLYLLRCLSGKETDFSISTIAAHLGHTDLDVKRALQYWEARHLLRLEYDWNQQLSGICLMDPFTHSYTQATPVTMAVPVSASAAVPNVVPVPLYARQEDSEPKIPDYSPKQVDSFTQNDDIKDLLFLAEFHTKKQLTPTDMNTVLFWYDELQLPSDVIEFLINYCVSEGHTKLSYMNKVAISWANAGIHTLPQAQNALLMHSDVYRTIMTSLGISGRNLTPIELEYMNRWTKEYGFSKEIIGEACSRAILRGTKNPFKYADKILLGWRDAGVATKADIEALDEKFSQQQAAKADSKTPVKSATWQMGNPAAIPPKRDRFTNYTQDESFDWDAYELKLLQRK